MEEKLYHPLSDLGRIKEDLLTLFADTESINKLCNNHYNLPYTSEDMNEQHCAIFLETSITELEGARIKDVSLDISIVCAKTASALSDEEKSYYQALGIYGNRADCLLQAIHTLITASEAAEILKKKYCIGSLSMISKNPIETLETSEGFFGKQMHYSYRSFCHFKK